MKIQSIASILVVDMNRVVYGWPILENSSKLPYPHDWDWFYRWLFDKKEKMNTSASKLSNWHILSYHLSRVDIEDHELLLVGEDPTSIVVEILRCFQTLVYRRPHDAGFLLAITSYKYKVSKPFINNNFAANIFFACFSAQEVFLAVNCMNFKEERDWINVFISSYNYLKKYRWLNSRMLFRNRKTKN